MSIDAIAQILSGNQSDSSSRVCAQMPYSVDCAVGDYGPLLTTSLVEYSIICAAVMFLLCRNVDKKPCLRELKGKRKLDFRVDCNSSAKGLFSGLLFVAATAVIIILFFIKVQANTADANMEALWMYIWLIFVLYVVSICATVVGFLKISSLQYMRSHSATTLVLDDILLFIALCGQLIHCVFSLVAFSELISLTEIMMACVAVLRMIQVLMQSILILTGQRLVARTSELQKQKPGRQVITFLLMINLAFFLVNLFETQKVSTNPVMVRFYGSPLWTVVVHSTGPLKIFFRFHSTVCLAEIWKIAYRGKTASESEE